jgi:hypothetical protein
MEIAPIPIGGCDDGENGSKARSNVFTATKAVGVAQRLPAITT